MAAPAGGIDVISIGVLEGVLSKICTTGCVTATAFAADADGAATTRGFNWVVVAITVGSFVAAACSPLGVYLSSPCPWKSHQCCRPIS